MLGKNLKYYRLRNEMSKKNLAEKVGVSPMTITNYEAGTRTPDMNTVKKLANALNVKVSDFVMSNSSNLQYDHAEFRKNTALSKNRQEYIKASVEEYFDRFYNVVEILGDTILPKTPRTHSIELSEDDEVNALNLRKAVNAAGKGPIDDLVSLAEDCGILIYLFNSDNESMKQFSGMNGTVNGRPYIVVKKSMTPERQRSTIAHELAHIMFKWPENITLKECEHRANAISGAFLFPKDDAIRELGIKRTAVTKDMFLVAKEYGISMLLLAMRAKICKIISEPVHKDFMIKASKAGWRTNEPSRIDQEETTLFEQFVYRAVTENDISIQKGAELLNRSYVEVAHDCCFEGEYEWSI
jgi:Zn-dependent peptidase ImmA (M78 family)/transcriptional regulator with XRE-family HTH domain